MLLTNESLEMYVLMCRAISKPLRLRILDMIGTEKMNVSDLQKTLDVPLSNLSNHLNDLYRTGVLGKEKQGNYVFYYMVEPKLLDAIFSMQNIFKTILSNRSRAQF